MAFDGILYQCKLHVHVCAILRGIMYIFSTSNLFVRFENGAMPVMLKICVLF